MFWDIENCPPPKGMRGTLVIDRLRSHLQERGAIRQVYAYGELSEFPQLLRVGLQRSGVHLIDTPHTGRKDVADFMIVTDMVMFAFDNPPPQTIVLVAGDIDYVYALSRLKLRGYRVGLVLPPVGANKDLIDIADFVLEWVDIMGTGVREEGKALRYEPLLVTLRELADKGQAQPTRETVADYLDEKYPNWRQTSTFDNLNDYLKSAEDDGWVIVQRSDDTTVVMLREEGAAAEEQVSLEDRFEPLVRVLDDLHEEGYAEAELALVGIRLREHLPDPLKALGVSRLKEYVLEAQAAGIVTVRADGLQNYVSLKTHDRRVPHDNRKVQALALLDRALESLRDDMIMPTDRAVIGRMTELGGGWRIEHSGFDSFDSLIAAAGGEGRVMVMMRGGRRVIFPAAGEFEYFDPEKDEEFTGEQWDALESYLRSHPSIITRGRYYFARRVQRAEIPAFEGMPLGKLIVLVQMAINRGWLVVAGPYLRVGSTFLSRDVF